MMFSIQAPSQDLLATIQEAINRKTKPIGALGLLESYALQIALVQQNIRPTLQNPQIMVFAADHGIAEAGVSAYPQEVSAQMVYNFVQGGAAINVFCRQYGIGLQVVDAGIKSDFPASLPIIHAKIAQGSRNFLHEAALSEAQLQEALQKGAALVQAQHAQGCNVIGFGEMGIGNTSSAALLMHCLTGLALEDCAGRGTGLNDQAYQHKLAILAQALQAHPQAHPPLEALCTFGGLEIAMMCGAMLQAASLKMLLLVDGFIASAAYLVAASLHPAIKQYSIACHQSAERGHRLLLEYLGLRPVLQLEMRLGEGTGCAMAYPILQGAVAFLRDMASFDEAGVSEQL